jgi:hypothetical protein
MKRLARRAAAILWPAFLVAAVLEILVFGFVDPGSLHALSGASLSLSDTAVYSIAFILFWACTSAACALTMLLEQGYAELNPAPRARR